MIAHQLKKLRKSHDLTLKVLADRVGYGTGNLSSYENGRLNPKDSTLLKILMKGFRFKEKEARVAIAEWRREHVNFKYALDLNQHTDPYQSGQKTLDDLLADEGLNEEGIRLIKNEINKLKRKQEYKDRV